MTVRFQNGDCKTIYPADFEADHKKDVYYYADTKTTEVSFYDNSDKERSITFLDGQVEIHYRNKSKEIRFADKSVQKITPDGLNETMEMPDGTKIITKFKADGSGK